MWKAAHELEIRVALLAEDDSFRGRGDLKDQIQRASLSVTNNIADGFELGTTQQMITFLDNAKGSAGEVRNMLLHALDKRLRWFGHLRSEISDLRSLVENVSRQLNGVPSPPPELADRGAEVFDG